jgi:hypothetical protein
MNMNADMRSLEDAYNTVLKAQEALGSFPEQHKSPKPRKAPSTDDLVDFDSSAWKEDRVEQANKLMPGGLALQAGMSAEAFAGLFRANKDNTEHYKDVLAVELLPGLHVTRRTSKAVIKNGLLRFLEGPQAVPEAVPEPVPEVVPEAVPEAAHKVSSETASEAPAGTSSKARKVSAGTSLRRTRSL